MTRALVTGAAGFIGSWLTEVCLKRGWELTAVDALSVDSDLGEENAASLRSAAHARFVEEDLLELDLERLLEGTDIVFHLAAETGVRAGFGDDFDRYLERNVRTTQRLLDAARAAHAGRFVLASSSSVYGDQGGVPTPESTTLAPTSPYGASKAMAEALVHVYARSHALDAVVLRYFTTYGPRQRPDMLFSRAIAAALDGVELPVYGDGRQSRDFVHVRDVVRATVAAAERGRGGATYNVASGTSASVSHALGLISSLTASVVPLVRLEPNAYEARATCADIGLARTELGFQPTYDIAAGLRDQIEWHVARRRGERAELPSSSA